MQSDDRRYIFTDKRINDLMVMTDGIFIKGAFARLDAAPLYREAVGVVGKFLGEAEILIEQFVMTYRLAGSLRQAAGLFPLPPVVMDVAAFDLMARGGRAP